MARGQGYGNKRRRRRRRSSRGNSLRDFFTRLMPDWMEWYDYVMIPLLVITGLWGVTHFEDVLLLFFRINIAILDVISLVGVLAGIILLIVIFTGRGGRRRRY